MRVSQYGWSLMLMFAFFILMLSVFMLDAIILTAVAPRERNVDWCWKACFFSIMTISIKMDSTTQPNDTKRESRNMNDHWCWCSHFLFLCWVSLCWMLLFWLSWRSQKGMWIDAAKTCFFAKIHFLQNFAIAEKFFWASTESHF